MARTVSGRKGSGRGRVGPQRRTNWVVPLIIAVLALGALGGWLVWQERRGPTVAAHDHPAGTADHTHDPVDLPHIHGLGYSADGSQLFVPAHTGLRIFADGVWLTPELPVHDYMGYTATDEGFYSSGHPGPGSDLPNPLGLVKSADGGKTLTTLGFGGETDFHIMGVGYKNHAIYVVNPAPNSRLSAGLHRSVDDGTTWQQRAMQGVTAQPIQLAVHPTDAEVVALATEAGAFLSTDAGMTFGQIGSPEPVTAVAWSPDGTQLVFGATTLSAYDLESKEITALNTPPIAARDAISAIAINPVQRDELTIATFERNIYRSENGGQDWQQIARAGTGNVAQ